MLTGESTWMMMKFKTKILEVLLYNSKMKDKRRKAMAGGMNATRRKIEKMIFR